MARHNDVGALGENVAADYLRARGYEVVETNFRKPYGEIDIVARETGRGSLWSSKVPSILVFVEVKSVSWETRQPGSVTRETLRPEENMHAMKLRRLGRVIMAYLAQKRYEGEWRLDLLTVRLDMMTRKARVEHIKNIVING